MAIPPALGLPERVFRPARTDTINSAANAVSTGRYGDAHDALTSLLQKLDGVGSPPDWMVAGPDKSNVRGDIELMEYLISLER